MVAQYFKAADAARIKNNVVRGLGAACGGRADLLRAIPSEDDHVFSKTPGETTKTPGDTLACKPFAFVARTQAQRCKNYVFVVVCTILRCVLTLKSSVRLALALCS